MVNLFGNRRKQDLLGTETDVRNACTAVSCLHLPLAYASGATLFSQLGLANIDKRSQRPEKSQKLIENYKKLQQQPA
jgi:hypothetical protein